jgi:hypothetical protein
LESLRDDTIALLEEEFPRIARCKCNKFVRFLGSFIEDSYAQRIFMFLGKMIFGLLISPVCAFLEIGEIVINITIGRKMRTFKHCTISCLLPLLTLLTVIPFMMGIADANLKNECFYCKKPIVLK